MENTTKKLQLIFGDVNLGVKGDHFHYIFSYQKNGLESLFVNGWEWLYREPKVAFWRATTDNDRGYQFSTDSAVWLGADLFPKCIDKTIKVNHEVIAFPDAPTNNQYSHLEMANTVEITYTFQTNTIPSTLVFVSYSVDETGDITISTTYKGKEGLPGLPAFGLRFIMPTPAKSFTYVGLSGETYPDRYKGGVPGEYTIEGLPVTPYLVPQECGMHMDTQSLRITRNTTLNPNDRQIDDFSLSFEKVDENFAFSCLPYTPFELENALHQDELPIARRTVLTIFGAVRGVGGIDSWSSGIEKAYEISAEEDHAFRFKINVNAERL